MAWFKVDDGLLMSRKVLSIPRSVRAEVMGVWTMAGVWAAHEMSDGVVPAPILDEMGCTEEIRELLVGVGLWLDAECGGVVFHDWSEYQPTRAELEAKRDALSQARSEVGRLGGQRSGEARRSKAEANAKQNGSKREAKRSPEPEPEPEPEPTTSKDVVRRASRIPEPFNVTPMMLEWAKTEVPAVDVGKETQKFADHHKAKGSLMKDWEAAWRNWMRRSREFQGDISQDSIEAARADRERRRVEHDRMVEEREKARALATPPPECSHGSTIVSCLTCARELAGVAS